MKLVITVIGKDRVGIIATVSNVLAENKQAPISRVVEGIYWAIDKKVNIISINQNIMNGFFNMVLIAEMTDKNIKLQDLQKLLKEKGAQLNVDIKAQHEDIFNAMHTIG